MNEIMKTPDISLAVALKMSGASMTGLEPLGQNKYLFLFYRSETLDSDVEKFYKGEIKASVNDVLGALRRLKQTIKYVKKL